MTKQNNQYLDLGEDFWHLLSADWKLIPTKLAKEYKIRKMSLPWEIASSKIYQADKTTKQPGIQ